MKGTCSSQKTGRPVGRWRKRWSLTEGYTSESEHQHHVTQQLCHGCRMLHIFSFSSYNLDERVEKFEAKWGYKVHSVGSCDYCLTSYYVTEVCAEAEKGGKRQGHNPSHCTSPSSSSSRCWFSTISVALTLITTCGDDVTGSLMLRGR